MRVSVVIPTLNAEKDLPFLLSELKKQSAEIGEIIVVDSESDDKTVDICNENPNVTLIQIKRIDFDHGRTRDRALRASKEDIVVFVTQDAIPANEFCIENLVSPLKDERIAISYARQLPKPDASLMEQLVRRYNYPEYGVVRSKDDLPRLGIKTYFCSDVCAAYNKRLYFDLGGFDFPLKTNEDMFFAAKAINAGYRVSYSSNAKVYHSHNFGLVEQYWRNYYQGYEIARHKEILNCQNERSEGIKLVAFVSKELIKAGDFLSLARFVLDCAARMLGNKNGKKAYQNAILRKNVTDH